MTESYEAVALNDDDLLLRRIPPWHQNRKDRRPNSDTFDDDAGSPMSVYVKSLLTDRGLEPEVVLETHDGYALAGVAVRLVRELGWTIEVEGGDPSDPYAFAHAHVVGDKRARGPRRRVARECTLLRWPEEDSDAGVAGG